MNRSEYSFGSVGQSFTSIMYFFLCLGTLTVVSGISISDGFCAGCITNAPTDNLPCILCYRTVISEVRNSSKSVCDIFEGRSETRRTKERPFTAPGGVASHPGHPPPIAGGLKPCNRVPNILMASGFPMGERSCYAIRGQHWCQGVFGGHGEVPFDV